MTPIFDSATIPLRLNENCMSEQQTAQSDVPVIVVRMAGLA